jgi:hypothetical protein
MGAHATHSIHENTVEAWETMDASTRAAEVLAVYATHGACTDRQVAVFLAAADMNFVRPTITRLKDDGALREVGRVKCETTGRTVRLMNRRPFGDAT